MLAEELDTLGASAIETADGGVAFAGDFTVMMRANLHSRFASRILWRLGGGRCRTEAELYRAASGIDWPCCLMSSAPSRSRPTPSAAR